MKTIKIKWKKDGEEIDAYVNISDIVIKKGRLPSGRSGGGSGDPPEYGSMVKYYISEDKEGEIIISYGQAVQKFDMDASISVKGFAVDALKKLPELNDMVEE